MTEKNPEAVIKPPRIKKKSYKVTATPKQKRAVIEISETIRTGESIGTALLKANYSKSTSESPTLVTRSKGFNVELRPVIERMIEERDRAISLMSKKIGKAKYRDMVESVDKLTKNIQLLTGGSTINADVKFLWGSEDEKPKDVISEQ